MARFLVPNRGARPVLAALLTCVLAPTVFARDATIVKIADSTTPIPGTAAGTFDRSSPFYDLQVDGTDLTFIGTGSENGATVHGLYLHRGGVLDVVVDNRTPMPGTGGSFLFFNRSDLEDGAIVFSADGPAVGESGVYRLTGDGLEVLADHRTPVPGTLDPFRSFESVALHRGSVVFGGGSTSHLFSYQDGMYRWADGVLETLVDSTTPVPGGSGTFPLVGHVGLDGHGHALTLPRFNTSFDDGIYRDLGSGLERVADGDTPMPGALANFDRFRAFSYDEGQVAFVASNAAGTWHGVYRDTAGALTVVADSATPVPGLGLDFLIFSNQVALSRGNVAFVGWWNPIGGGPSVAGLFVDLDGDLCRLIQYGDLFDGKVVDRLVLAPGSLDGSRLAFAVGFTDDTFGLYLAELPLFVDGFETGDLTRWSAAVGL